MSDLHGWIGVDLDGTLAHYDGWKGADHIGQPVPEMLGRVQNWVKAGRDVRILTARVSHDGSASRMVAAQMATIHIMDWCARYVGKVLPVTCTKDYAMIELWDDRAVTVIANMGQTCCELARQSSRVTQDEERKRAEIPKLPTTGAAHE